MKLLVPPPSLSALLLKAKALWQQWDVPTLVLTSFAFQLILILLSPFRKQTSKGIIILSVWLAYLLADWIAIQAIAVISKPYEPMTQAEVASAELYAFWAQFLLLHLGGPDNITALATEDADLWHRTGLHLGVQVVSSFGALAKIITQYKSRLWVPTVLMFLAGILKYLERISSLFHGRLLNFSDREIPSMKLEDYKPKPKKAPTGQGNTKVLSNVEMVTDAFYFFHYYKGLYAGQEFTFQQRDDSFKYLLERTPEQAFRVVGIQLNFAYEVFYTKTLVIHTMTSWKVLRVVVTSLQVVCLLIWLVYPNKHDFPYYDIKTTDVLLYGAIVVELLGFLRKRLSYWAIAQYKKISLTKRRIYNRLLSTQSRIWGRYSRKEDASTWACLMRVFFRCWSESISQLNLIRMCTDQQRYKLDNFEKLFEFVGRMELLNRHKYVTQKWFTDDLRDFIFQDLKRKADSKGSFYNIGHVKGGWACMCFAELLDAKYPHTKKMEFASIFRLFNVNTEYDILVLHWHIITELMYMADEKPDDERNPVKRLINMIKGCICTDNTEENLEAGQATKPANSEEKYYREICKTLSDYLFYLLNYHQEMMPTVPATRGRLKHVKEKLKEKLKRRSMWGSGKSENFKKAFESLVSETPKKPDYEFQIPNFQMDEIIKELVSLEKADLVKLGKWKFMAELWAELMYYAAIRCKASLHADRLKQGGELLTHVWLLSLQFGFGLYESEHARLRSEKEKDLVKCLLYSTDNTVNAEAYFDAVSIDLDKKRPSGAAEKNVVRKLLEGIWNCCCCCCIQVVKYAKG